MGDIFQHSIKINGDYSTTILNKKSVAFKNSAELAQWLFRNKHTTNSTGYLVNQKPQPPHIDINKIYPVGSIYLTIANINPESIIGGTWEAIKKGCALWTTDVSDPTNTTTSTSNIITEGLPNITGSTKYLSPDVVWNNTADGCFTGYSGGGPSVTNVRTSGSGGGYKFNFDASASNAIYGRTTNVQPQAYKVYAWRRMA